VLAVDQDELVHQRHERFPPRFGHDRTANSYRLQVQGIEDEVPFETSESLHMGVERLASYAQAFGQPRQRERVCALLVHDACSGNKDVALSQADTSGHSQT
jgi:hypothetical protein